LPLKAWRNVKGSLIKIEPIIMDEVFKQPLFGNPHIPHLVLENFNINVLVGTTMALVGFKRFNIRRTMAFIAIHNNLLINIPWDLGAIPSKIVLGD
jgi:hypothetical protein